MKIGINALSIVQGKTGGGETYLSELVKHLAKIDTRNEYFLFITRQGGGAFSISQPNFKKVVIPKAVSNLPFRIFAEHVMVPLVALKHNIQILFYPTDFLPLFIPCSSVMTIQNLIYFHFNELFPLANIHGRKRIYAKLQFRYYKLMMAYSARKADKIIAVSNNVKSEIKNLLNVDYQRVSVVHHGVNSMFKPVTEPKNLKAVSLEYNLPEQYILSVSGLSPYKNFERLIEAMAILKERGLLTHKLIIVGDDRVGYKLHLRQIAEELDVINQIDFLGIVPHCKLPAIYSGARLFILLSSCESFGLPILEAMACGCPVICSNRSSLPEIAGGAALLVESDDVSQIANTIASVISNPALGYQLSLKGLQRVKDFSWENTARKTLDVFEKVHKSKFMGLDLQCN